MHWCIEHQICKMYCKKHFHLKFTKYWTIGYFFNQNIPPILPQRHHCVSVPMYPSAFLVKTLYQEIGEVLCVKPDTSAATFSFAGDKTSLEEVQVDVAFQMWCPLPDFVNIPTFTNTFHIVNISIINFGSSKLRNMSIVFQLTAGKIYQKCYFWIFFSSWLRNR